MKNNAVFSPSFAIPFSVQVSPDLNFMRLTIFDIRQGQIYFVQNVKIYRKIIIYERRKVTLQFDI